jgi:hypothetical protein
VDTACLTRGRRRQERASPQVKPKCEDLTDRTIARTGFALVPVVLFPGDGPMGRGLLAAEGTPLNRTGVAEVIAAEGLPQLGAPAQRRARRAG